MIDIDPIFVLPNLDNASISGREIASKVNIIVREQDYDERNSRKLNEILGAIKLDVDNDVSIYRCKKGDSFPISTLINHNSSVPVLVFGLSPEEVCMQLNYVLFNWVRLESSSVLFSTSLSELIDDKQLKLKLWNALKSEFL